MTHEFEVNADVALPATPEHVWDAIATGPGVDSWFIGRNEIADGENGAVRRAHLGREIHGTITGWEPGKRFAWRTDNNPDGTFMAFEYLIEARDGGSTVVRMVQNGMLGDDWEDEYDALGKGSRIYFNKLAAYFRRFAGRHATHNLFAMGPTVADADQTWPVFLDAFGLTEPVDEGTPARLSVPGVEPATASVEFAGDDAIAVSTVDGLYLLGHGYLNMTFIEYHGFSTRIDSDDAWTNWLTHAFD